MMSFCIHKKMRVDFLIGMIAGVVITFTLHSMLVLQETTYVDIEKFNAYAYETVGGDEQTNNHRALHDNNDRNIQPIKINDEHLHHDEDAVAKDLFKKVRILCWVMTSPKTLGTKAIHVKNTWGKRCNKILFMSSVANETFPAIGLNVSEGREHLTAKTRQAFQYIYEHHFDEADWFMKSDDDTYVILENLRYFLSGEDTNVPIFFGHHFKTIIKQGYFSGGAGYVLSKEALRRLSTNKTVKCAEDGGPEDAVMGGCMQRLGVKAGNSTDSSGRSRFHCFGSQTHLMGGYPNWYYKYDALGGRKGEEILSDYAIAFHYVKPQAMYGMEYCIYHLRPYGIMDNFHDINRKKT